MLKVYRHILIEKRMEREMNAFAKTDVGIERASIRIMSIQSLII